jgi:hypothetical protein
MSRSRQLILALLAAALLVVVADPALAGTSEVGRTSAARSGPRARRSCWGWPRWWRSPCSAQRDVSGGLVLALLVVLAASCSPRARSRR